MLRIVEIIDKNNFRLLCKFNNGELRLLNVLPIIENQKHLNGVESILDNRVFVKAKIGHFGEIVWPNIVKTHKNGHDILWDYDISPEYVYFNSSTLETIL